MPTLFFLVIINKKENKKKSTKIVYSECLLRLGVLRVFVLLGVGFIRAI